MKPYLLPALALLWAMSVAPAAYAGYPVAVHGNVQADVLFPELDEEIGAGPYDHKVLFNVYAGVNLASEYVDAGLRFEFMKWPVPGYESLNGYAGWGVPNIYVKGKYKGFDLTAGDFYEQFGSGFILRTYEDRSLGIDNSIRGGRLNINAVPGMKLTLLGGVQRRFWDWDVKNQVYGANLELYMEDYIKSMQDHGASWMIGGSYVLKNEKTDTITITKHGTNYYLNIPNLVNAVDVRSSFASGPWSVMAEFAWKGQDPSFDNSYTYGNGTAYMLTGSFSKKGISAMLQAKRSYNMSFRTQRNRSDNSVFINNMPAFTYKHTNALTAFYPYQTQYANGEWAFEGAFSYLFPRKSPLGGRYGTKVSVNASYVAGLVQGKAPDEPLGTIMGTNGYNPSFFKMGSCNFYDINVQVEKRFSNPLTMTFMYANQTLNNQVTPIVETDEKFTRTNVLVVDAKYKFNKKFTLRGEAQYLFTKQDQKDWAYGMLEFSWTPYLMVSVSDMWNCGDTGTHYYMFGVTGNYRNNRLALSYGRTRRGFDCSGGMCREVPSMHGFQINYTFNF